MRIQCDRAAIRVAARAFRGSAIVKRHYFDALPCLAMFALPLLIVAAPAPAQDLTDRPAPLPPPSPTAPPKEDDQVQFSADSLDYDTDADVVTASGDVRMYRSGDRLRADKVVWNRKTGQVVATGNVVVTNPGGDAAYGDSIELTDSLKDGMVQNILVVLDQGGRIAARRGTRRNGIVTMTDAAFTRCAVTNAEGCPKQPSWKITAVRVTYDPGTERIYFRGARFNLFGLPSLPLPAFSSPVGNGAHSGLLTPDFRYTRTNGVELAVPYYWKIADNRGLTITPHVFSRVLPMLQFRYEALTGGGAYQISGYATSSPRTDTLTTTPAPTQNAFRGYIESSGRFQLTPNWNVSGSLRATTDRTFLRRYDISREDLLRSTVKVERIDSDSYFAVTGWAVQTLRVRDRQGLQPFALPELDYRRRFVDPLAGGTIQLQLNTLALSRTSGQDTQRAFASAQWTLRGITRWGQQVSATAYLRGDLYHASDTALTSVAGYRGEDGVHARGIAALAIDVKWPFVGAFLTGTQRLTPRVQIVASPRIANLLVPNEDSRAVDLQDSNLFALNRFPGYDRFEDSTRFTYGLDWSATLPAFSISATIGQSYRLSSRPTLLPSGTGLDGRFSDIVGRTELRYRDLVSLIHRYRLDKTSLAVRRNEIDATVGTRASYVLVGYLRLNRNITTALEDLRDREEVRLGARVQFRRFWSVFGSTIIDLTDRADDALSVANGFDPIRHRIGIAYEDDCLKLGLTWKRDYQDTGDARRGDSFLLTLAFKNLGR